MSGGWICVLFVVLVVIIAAMQRPRVNPAIVCRQCHVKGKVAIQRVRHRGVAVDRATCGHCRSVYTL